LANGDTPIYVAYLIVFHSSLINTGGPPYYWLICFVLVMGRYAFSISIRYSIFWQQTSRYSISIFSETALINTRAHGGIRPLRFSRIKFERVTILMHFQKFLEPTISHFLMVSALKLVIEGNRKCILQKAPVLKIAEIATREQGRHLSAEFPAFS
jgi:hypothetical protein